MTDISEIARQLGKLGGEKTKQRGKEYYRRIGRKGLAKRYKKPALDPDQKNA